MHDSPKYRQFLELQLAFSLQTYPSPLELVDINRKKLALKRDDKLQMGCSKERSIIPLIDHYLQKGADRFTVSSTGNAALVAVYAALRDKRIKHLHVFFSTSISDKKLASILRLLPLLKISDIRNNIAYQNITFQLCENPKQEAFQLVRQGYINLRGSTDDLALEGFKSIAYELHEQCNQVEHVFIPASSGTTAMGVFQGFQGIGCMPQIHVVQTTKVHALLKRVARDHAGEAESEHPAESILDIIGHRRAEIEHVISHTQGRGWIITARSCKIAQHELQERFGITTSPDSALTYAAYKQAIEHQELKNAVLLFTG